MLELCIFCYQFNTKQQYVSEIFDGTAERLRNFCETSKIIYHENLTAFSDRL